MRIVEMVVALIAGAVSSAVTWLVSRRRQVIDEDTGLASGARVLIDGSADVVESMQRHMDRLDSLLTAEQQRTDRLQEQVSRLSCTVSSLTLWVEDVTDPDNWRRYRQSDVPPTPPEMSKGN